MEPWLVEYQRFNTIIEQVLKYIAADDHSPELSRSLNMRLMNAHTHCGAALFGDSPESEKTAWKIRLFNAITDIYGVVCRALNEVL